MACTRGSSPHSNPPPPSEAFQELLQEGAALGTLFVVPARFGVVRAARTPEASPTGENARPDATNAQADARALRST